MPTCMVQPDVLEGLCININFLPLSPLFPILFTYMLDMLGIKYELPPNDSVTMSECSLGGQSMLNEYSLVMNIQVETLHHCHSTCIQWELPVYQPIISSFIPRLSNGLGMRPYYTGSIL